MRTTRIVSALAITLAGLGALVGVVLAGGRSPEHLPVTERSGAAGNTGVGPTTSSSSTSTTSTVPPSATSWTAYRCTDPVLNAADEQTMHTDFGATVCTVMTSGDTTIWTLVGLGSTPAYTLPITGTTVARPAEVSPS